MSYAIPIGYSRLTFDYAAVSTQGSKPSWGIGVAASPDLDIVGIAQDWFVDKLKPLTSTAAILERIQMRNDFEVRENLVSIAGTQVAAQGPPSNAALISLTTGLIGRQNRGRVYWPFVLPESDLDGGGVIAPTKRTALNAAFGELVTDLSAAEAPLVILHSTELTPTPVTAWTTQELSATQRRRLRG